MSIFGKNVAITLLKEELVKTQRDLAVVRAENGVLREQNKVLQVNLDWMRQRVNQVEVERAQLLRHTTHIAMPAPEIVPAPPIDLNEMPSMEDIGDAEASRIGVDWNPDGTLKYRA